MRVGEMRIRAYKITAVTPADGDLYLQVALPGAGAVSDNAGLSWRQSSRTAGTQAMALVNSFRGVLYDGGSSVVSHIHDSRSRP